MQSLCENLDPEQSMLLWKEPITTSFNHGQCDVSRYIHVINYIDYDKSEKIDSNEETISFPSNLYFLAVFTQCHQITNLNNFKLAKKCITFSYIVTQTFCFQQQFIIY